MLDKVLLIVTSGLVLMALIFAIGAVFVPGFREGGSAIVGVILGAIVSGLGAIVTAGYVTKELRKPNVKNGNGSDGKDA